MSRVFLAALTVSAPAAALDFLVMADWGGQIHEPYTTGEELATAKGMAKHAKATNASFVLAVGDNFYDKGVKSVDDQRFKTTFEDVFSSPHLDMPFYVAVGNHDHFGNVQAQVDYSGKSKRWKLPSLYYSFVQDLGGGATLEFVMLDTVTLAGNSDVRDPSTGDLRAELTGDRLPGPADAAAAEEQIHWLHTTLRASNATYLVVAGHYPIWSICEHGPTSYMVDNVKPLLKKYHVTAYIAGHDHCMESFVDDDIDYHGMGASHENAHSTAHRSQVPLRSLKFHTPGKNGGFGSFTVSATSFVARHHEGDGTLLYTHPTRAPRAKWTTLVESMPEA